MPFPFDPALRHPMRFADGRENPGIVHLARAIDHPNIEVGEYTYANDFDPPAEEAGGWAARLAPYLYPGAPERLVIGRYGQIAHGARFITASANHAMTGISTFPFGIFDAERIASMTAPGRSLPDTVIGPDCWIGHGALILPGARLGAGVIVGAGAVVAGSVPDYAVVAGNPARILRRRFAPEIIERLMALRWWDWEPERVRAAEPALAAGDVLALAGMAPEGPESA